MVICNLESILQFASDGRVGAQPFVQTVGEKKN